jgi:putative endonuclease
MSDWFVYILKCADDSFYTGIATNLERRISEHNGHGAMGAKYTRGRRPVVLVYQETVKTRSAALVRENEIKRLSRLGKKYLIDLGACTE